MLRSDVQRCGAVVEHSEIDGDPCGSHTHTDTHTQTHTHRHRHRGKREEGHREKERGGGGGGGKEGRVPGSGSMETVPQQQKKNKPKNTTGVQTPDSGSLLCAATASCAHTCSETHAP